MIILKALLIYIGIMLAAIIAIAITKAMIEIIIELTKGE